MKIPVLIERVKNNGFRAHGGEPLALSADGETQEEALANLKEKMAGKLSKGGVLVSFELPAEPHPLAGFVGIFKDDPWINDWKKSVKSYRKKRDKDTGTP